MKKVKPCDLCGLGIATFTCSNCGSQVCEKHYNKKTGLCTNCPSKL